MTIEQARQRIRKELAGAETWYCVGSQFAFYDFIKEIGVVIELKGKLFWQLNDALNEDQYQFILSKMRGSSYDNRK